MDKDQIASAFQRHFHQFGFKKTAVDDVARELQISKKTIYQHFSTKEEILQYVIQRAARAYLEDIVEQIPAGMDEAAQLERLLRLIHQVAREFHASGVSFELQFKLELAEAAYRQAYTQVIAGLIAAGVQKGIFHCGDLQITTHYANLLVAESLHLMTQHSMLQHPEKSPEEETIRAVQKLLA